MQTNSNLYDHFQRRFLYILEMRFWFLLSLLWLTACMAKWRAPGSEFILPEPRRPTPEVESSAVQPPSVSAGIAAFTKKVRENPFDAVAQYNLGVSFDRAGRIDAAISCYRNAILCDRLFTEPYYNLGYDLILKQEYEAAFEQLVFADWLSPNDKEIRTNTEVALAHAVYRNLQQCNPRRADSLFALFQALCPDHPLTRGFALRIGAQLLAQNDTLHANPLLVRASLLKSDDSLNTNARVDAAEALFLLGNYYAGLRTPDDTLLLMHLKNASWALNSCAERKTDRAGDALMLLTGVYVRMGTPFMKSGKVGEMRQAMALFVKACDTYLLSRRISRELGEKKGGPRFPVNEELFSPMLRAETRFVDTLVNTAAPDTLKDSLPQYHMAKSTLLEMAGDICAATAEKMQALLPYVAPGRKEQNELQQIYLSVLSAMCHEEAAMVQELERSRGNEETFDLLRDIHDLFVRQRANFTTRYTKAMGPDYRPERMELDILRNFERLQNISTQHAD